MSMKKDGIEVVRIMKDGVECVRIMKDGVELWTGAAACFNAGYWNDSKPWLDKYGWKD